MKVILIFIVALFSCFSYAQGSGDFDSLFGIDTGGASDGDGKVLIEHNLAGIDYEYGAAVYYYSGNNGKILVGGNIHYNSGDINMVVTRLLYDGTIDTNFGNNGHREVAFDLSAGMADNQDTLHDIQVDEGSGYIYLIGSAQRNTVDDTDFAVARLTGDGDLDTTFATNSNPGNGKLVVPFDLGGGLEDVALSGVIDNIHRVNPPNDLVNSLYVVGFAESTVGSDFAVAKIHISTDGGHTPGDLVTFFNSDGKLNIDFPGSSNSRDKGLGIYPASSNLQKLWVVGYHTQNDGSKAPALVYMDYYGNLETDFSNDGKFVYNEIRPDINIKSVAKHPTRSGDFIFVGTDPHTGSFPAESEDCAISYVHVPSSLNTPVGDRFNFQLDLNEGTILELNSSCSSAAFGHHGELVIAGNLYSHTSGSNFKMALMRFSSFEVTNGSSSYSIDLGFGVDGKKNYFFTDDMAPTRPGQIVDVNNHVRIVKNSKNILLTGQATNQNGDERIALTRLIGSGTDYPLVSINSPAHASIFPYNTNITFDGNALDNEDGDISSSLIWSSTIDGQFGIGATVNASNLSNGLHTITATVTDSNGQSDFEQIFLEVNDVIFKNGFEQ